MLMNNLLTKNEINVPDNIVDLKNIIRSFLFFSFSRESKNQSLNKVLMKYGKVTKGRNTQVQYTIIYAFYHMKYNEWLHPP